MDKNAQSRIREGARRPNGKFGQQHRAESDVTFGLNAERMPGLASDQAGEWSNLDRKVVASNFAADALVGAERARYEFYSNLVDEAVTRGERGWLPACPVHSQGGDGHTPDGWGQDFSCPVCMDPSTGKTKSVNRLGIGATVEHEWARATFDAHTEKYADAADFFASRAARNPAGLTFIDIETPRDSA